MQATVKKLVVMELIEFLATVGLAFAIVLAIIAVILLSVFWMIKVKRALARLSDRVGHVYGTVIPELQQADEERSQEIHEGVQTLHGYVDQKQTTTCEAFRTVAQVSPRLTNWPHNFGLDLYAWAAMWVTPIRNLHQRKFDLWIIRTLRINKKIEM